jgi:hypothetical protein
VERLCRGYHKKGGHYYFFSGRGEIGIKNETEKNMKDKAHKKKPQYTCFFVILMTLALFTSVKGSAEDKKGQPKGDLRKTAVEMKELYDDGKLNKLIDLYNEKCCEDKGDNSSGEPGKEKKEFKKAEKEIRADIYQLVTLSYDALNRPGMRDIYLKKLLDIRPNVGAGVYWPSLRRIAEEKYIVLPRLLLGVNAGLNITRPHPYKRYSILGPDASTGWDSFPKDYSNNLAHLWGAQLGGALEYTLTKNLSINMQISAISLAFRYKNNVKQENKGEGSGENQQMSLDFTHRHELYYLEIPLLLKYRFINKKSKLKPYLQIGGFLRILQFALKSIDTIPDTGYSPYFEENTKSFYLNKLVTGTNSGFCAGVGISYDTVFMGFPLRLEFGINYKHGFNNIIDEDHRYEYEELISAYYDVFDDIKLRSWDLHVKILLPVSFKAFKR